MDWSVLKEFFPNAVKIFCLLPNNDPKPLISSNLQHNFKKNITAGLFEPLGRPTRAR
jgi:hypothetical protein